MSGEMLIHHEGVWREMWRQLDLALGTSVASFSLRGYLARGVEWALRGHELLVLKIRRLLGVSR